MSLVVLDGFNTYSDSLWSVILFAYLNALLLLARHEKGSSRRFQLPASVQM